MKIILTFLFFCLASCQENLSDIDPALKEWLYKADPGEDFQKAIEKKDYKFYAVYGVSFATPGTSVECLDYKKDIKLIKNTSDSSDNFEQVKYNLIARAYAESYNGFMESYLRKHMNFDCSKGAWSTGP